MATLTRYNTFKSLKQNSTVKTGKAVAPKNKVKAEMEAFVQLLTTTKEKKVKHK